ncbi:hypothetical protein E3N88_19774 [Mikania micrantha]|uniref:Uncharacterized protein n=1 Tax=Mikania micrantha TaxID=192012 RepID=A0A5N6NRX3_9ASTR|nr:hypothetical protein E3N88_19774 [Mikania micrantha]
MAMNCPGDEFFVGNGVRIQPFLKSLATIGGGLLYRSQRGDQFLVSFDYYGTRHQKGNLGVGWNWNRAETKGSFFMVVCERSEPKEVLDLIYSISSEDFNHNLWPIVSIIDHKVINLSFLLIITVLDIRKEMLVLGEIGIRQKQKTYNLHVETSEQQSQRPVDHWRAEIKSEADIPAAFLDDGEADAG